MSPLYYMPLLQVGGHHPTLKTAPVYAEVDEEDLERVSQYNWTLHKRTDNLLYAFATVKCREIHLHRFIMGLGDFKDDKRIIDHKDGNGLNNKKENLTICDKLYNSQSFRQHGTRGVGSMYYDDKSRRVKKWRACIIIMKVKHVCHFLTEQEGRDWIQILVKQYTDKEYENRKGDGQQA